MPRPPSRPSKISIFLCSATPLTKPSKNSAPGRKNNSWAAPSWALSAAPSLSAKPEKSSTSGPPSKPKATPPKSSGLSPRSRPLHSFYDHSLSRYCITEYYDCPYQPNAKVPDCHHKQEDGRCCYQAFVRGFRIRLRPLVTTGIALPKTAMHRPSTSH